MVLPAAGAVACPTPLDVTLQIVGERLVPGRVHK
jgi:hypothetical protein